MPLKRAQLFDHVCDLIGPTIGLRDSRDGWPGIAEIASQAGPLRAAMHVSNVSSHARKVYERRFQNPGDGSPVSDPNGASPILVGLADVDGVPILVVLDGTSRLNRNARFSILFNFSILQEAAVCGWAEYVSGAREKITAMHPRLFPAYLDAFKYGIDVSPILVADAVEASGLLETQAEVEAERARTMVTKLVRRAAFGRDVCRAYDQKCAMCEIDMGLLEGAHILPANVPGSPDQVFNGLSLCRNHHRSFDLGNIWIDPDTLDVEWHPEIFNRANLDPAAEKFLAMTRAELVRPVHAANHPSPEMFQRRYESAGSIYGWR